jgi:hypothetical protein
MHFFQTEATEDNDDLDTLRERDEMIATTRVQIELAKKEETTMRSISRSQDSQQLFLLKQCQEVRAK